MGLEESRGKIGRGMRDLMALWASTQVHWNDDNTKAFEEKYLRSMEMDIKVAAGAMDQMAALLSQIRRECE
jgi:hypothetical protein